jgi:hypothetical protein
MKKTAYAVFFYACYLQLSAKHIYLTNLSYIGRIPLINRNTYFKYWRFKMTEKEHYDDWVEDLIEEAVNLCGNLIQGDANLDLLDLANLILANFSTDEAKSLASQLKQAA